jgi:dTDP-4-dehydrorhamnose 3,5-epimerase
VIFTETAVAGAWLVTPEPAEDSRGFFARVWCEREFGARGLAGRWAQCSISFNKQRGTLRGLHYQHPPHGEAKLVRCTTGAIYDVVLDLRRDSPTFLKHAAAELNASNRLMMYVPEGCAHGFQTLQDGTEVFYQMSASYAPEHAAGVRWDDPAFGISWPYPDPTMSDRDRQYPDFQR